MKQTGKETIHQNISGDIWDKANTDSLLEVMAEQFVPVDPKSDPFWVNAARTMFSSAASRMRQDKNRSIQKLIKLLLIEDISVLTAYLKGTPFGEFVEQENSKVMTSIRNILFYNQQQINKGQSDKFCQLS